jgi:hypothetical protein
MSVVETRNEIRDSKAAIDKVEAAIDKVEAAIDKVVEEINHEKDPEDKKALSKREDQLREEKRQLNERLNILLQQQQQQQHGELRCCFRIHFLVEHRFEFDSHSYLLLFNRTQSSSSNNNLRAHMLLPQQEQAL